MSVQGRISKAKKHLYEAKGRLDNLLPKDFTPNGRAILISLRGEIGKDIVTLAELKMEIVKKQDKEPVTE